MLTGLIYAATIGDESYLKISDKTLEPYPNLKRPFPFIPVDMNKGMKVIYIHYTFNSTSPASH